MKRKLILVALWLTVLLPAGFPQISVLFVIDNGLNPSNTATMTAALNQTGFYYDIFDAVTLQRSPTYEEMMNYQLVLWYTSTDGVGLYFWNGTDSDNNEIITYLNEGGSMVVMGNDFLYDRYATNAVFTPGEFVYDYLGTALYFGQSYGNDGGMGVPQLDLEPGHSIVSLNPVQWIFPTLWWVDACLTTSGAIPVYRMGPPSYPLSQYFSAIYAQQNNSRVFSLFFDPALIDTDQNRITLLSEILYFFSSTLGVEKDLPERKVISIQPNPANNYLTVTCLRPCNASGLRVFNMQGLEIYRGDCAHTIQIDVSSWKEGLYLVATDDGHFEKVMVLR